MLDISTVKFIQWGTIFIFCKIGVNTIKLAWNFIPHLKIRLKTWHMEYETNYFKLLLCFKKPCTHVSYHREMCWKKRTRHIAYFKCPSVNYAICSHDILMFMSRFHNFECLWILSTFFKLWIYGCWWALNL